MAYKGRQVATAPCTVSEALSLTRNCKPMREKSKNLVSRVVSLGLPRQATREKSQGLLSRRRAEIPECRPRSPQSESGKYRTHSSGDCARGLSFLLWASALPRV